MRKSLLILLFSMLLLSMTVYSASALGSYAVTVPYTEIGYGAGATTYDLGTSQLNVSWSMYILYGSGLTWNATDDGKVHFHFIDADSNDEILLDISEPSANVSVVSVSSISAVYGTTYNFADGNALVNSTTPTIKVVMTSTYFEIFTKATATGGFTSVTRYYRTGYNLGSIKVEDSMNASLTAGSFNFTSDLTGSGIDMSMIVGVIIAIVCIGMLGKIAK